MLVFDQLDRQIDIRMPIKAVVSLVPSHTELLLDLGLKGKLKGRTKFCIHPQELVKSIPIVGGTKTIHFDRIDRIKPDLIICNKEENNKDDVLKLAEKYPVWVSEIKTLEDSIQMVQEMAILFNTQSLAEHIINRSREAIQHLKQAKSVHAAYLIWRKPYMAVGSDTYIHHMMCQLGFQNVFSNKSRYPEVSIDDLLAANPDTILLSSEPYPFTKEHKKELEAVLPNMKIHLVDGEVFSWYGSRMIHKHRF